MNPRSQLCDAREWTAKSLDDIGRWPGGATPSKGNPGFWKNGQVLWVTPKDVRGATVVETADKLTDSGARLLNRYHAGSLIVVGRSGILRHTLPVAIVSHPFTVNQDLKVLVPHESDDTIHHFVLHSLLNREHELLGKLVKAGTTVESIDWTTFGTVRISWPPRCERKRICEILETADVAIRNTAQVVSKLRFLRDGLLHDLLTRGVDPRGRLRGAESHSEEFQESPLGKIPCTWKVAKLGDILRENGGLLQTGPFGSQLHSNEYVAEGVSVVMPQDIKQDGTVDEAGAAKITEDRASTLARHRLRQGDVVFARRGDLSRCCAVPDRMAAICGTGCLLFRPPSKLISAEWFVSLYRHEMCQRQIASRAVGTTMVNLNTQLLSDLLLCVPPIDEQKRIVEHFKSFEHRRATEESRLAKLIVVRRGLAHDLLTGRVRVKV